LHRTHKLGKSIRHTERAEACYIFAHFIQLKLEDAGSRAQCDVAVIEQ
jgi:hypothetical protein